MTLSSEYATYKTRPYSGLGFQVRKDETFEMVPFPLRSKVAAREHTVPGWGSLVLESSTAERPIGLTAQLAD